MIFLAEKPVWISLIVINFMLHFIQLMIGAIILFWKTKYKISFDYTIIVAITFET